MNYKIVSVKNVTRLSNAGDALIDRGLGMPGMGLIWGHTGYGKSTAATWFVNRVHGVYVRAMATWTPSAMLGAILRELEASPKGSCAQMAEVIVEKLAQSGRPLFIDEADYLVDNKRMTETLRDLHDLSTVPVILIGMAGIQRSLQHRQQLFGRIAQWVEFQPADLDDTRILADALCEVEVADDLLEQLYRAASVFKAPGAKVTGASVRLVVVGLARIEHYARTRGLESINSSQWRGGNEFFLGHAPRAQQARPGRTERTMRPGLKEAV